MFCVDLFPVWLHAHCHFKTLGSLCYMLVCVCATQPKVRTSSEESMAGEDDRGKKHSSLLAPTPLIRTSSGTHVRPKLQPRSSRYSGAPPSHHLHLHVDNMAEKYREKGSVYMQCKTWPICLRICYVYVCVIQTPHPFPAMTLRPTSFLLSSPLKAFADGNPPQRLEQRKWKPLLPAHHIWGVCM